MKVFFKITAIVLFLGLGGCLDIEQDYVAVVGVGEARQFPDSAAMTVSLTRKGDTAEQAVRELNIVITKLREASLAFEVQEEDVRSLYLDVTRTTRSVRRPDGSRVSEDTGFQAEQALNFRIKDIHRAGELLGTLVSAGAESVSQPVYEISDEAVLFENARQLAIKDAKRRASEYVKSTGKKLGTVEIIEESGTQSQRLSFQLRDRMVERYSQDESGGSADVASPAMMLPSSYVTDIFSRPQEIAVTVSIYVKYALED